MTTALLLEDNYWFCCNHKRKSSWLKHHFLLLHNQKIPPLTADYRKQDISFIFGCWVAESGHVRSMVAMTMHETKEIICLNAENSVPMMVHFFPLIGCTYLLQWDKCAYFNFQISIEIILVKLGVYRFYLRSKTSNHLLVLYEKIFTYLCCLLIKGNMGK